MRNVKNTIVDTLLSFVAPHLCSGCGLIGGTFCDNCKYNIISEPFSCCIVCGNPHNTGICYDHKVPFQQAYVVGERNGALQRLIGGFKFRNMKESYRPLAALLDNRLPSLDNSAVLVPIPTIPAHIRERGYDHMLLIAYELGRLRKLPVQCLLTRDGLSVQHKASRAERLLQAAHAYSIAGNVDPRTTYVLLDDIVTTGATLLYAAQLLHQAGATTILVAAIARQPLD